MGLNKLSILNFNNRDMKYPICPECGENTIVLFAPPKEGKSCSADDVEWKNVDIQRTHLYCCNGSSTCKFNTKIQELTTPLTEARYKKF